MDSQGQRVRLIPSTGEKILAVILGKGREYFLTTLEDGVYLVETALGFPAARSITVTLSDSESCRGAAEELSAGYHELYGEIFVDLASINGAIAALLKEDTEEPAPAAAPANGNGVHRNGNGKVHIRSPFIIFKALASPSDEFSLRACLEEASAVAGALDPIYRVRFTQKLRDVLVEKGIDEGDAKAMAKVACKVDDKKEVEEGALPKEQGEAIKFEPVEPWEEEVNGAELLEEIAAAFSRFAVLVPHAKEALALWCVHSHALAAAEFAPRLVVTSPTRRCGKTNVLKILAALVNRPLPGSGGSVAYIFRVIQASSPTLILDEADTYLDGDESQALRGLLNSGHSRKMAYYGRTVGDNHEPRRFRTWAAMAIGRIGELQGPLADRSIRVLMKRKTKAERVERLREACLDELAPLKRRIVRWVRDELEALKDCRPDLPEDLGDRAQDNWEPLLAIADRAGGDWPARARGAALALSKDQDDQDGQEIGVLLLGDIARRFQELRVEAIATEELLAYLVGLDERPWPEFTKGRPLTPRGLSNLLRRFGVRPAKFDGHSAHGRGYRLDALLDVFSRFVPEFYPPQPPPMTEVPDGATTSGGGGWKETQDEIHLSAPNLKPNNGDAYDDGGGWGGSDEDRDVEEHTEDPDRPEADG